MSNLSYLYDLYETIFIKTTEDINYAINWLLNQVISNKHESYIVVKSYYNNNDECIIEGIIKYNKEINRIIKAFEYNSTYTVYSPYDTTIFGHTHNFNLYRKLAFGESNMDLNNFNSNNVNNVNNVNNNYDLKQEKEKTEKENIKDIFSSIVQTSQDLKVVSSKLKKEEKQNNKEESDNDTDTESETESIDSKELEEMQKKLDKMLEDKINIDNLVKERDEELCDLRCEDSFQKRKQIKVKEKEEEKKNIFRGDLNVYKKIIEKYTKSENSDLEKFIPPLFEAKFYVFHYMNLHNMINDSDYEEPSEELYELYNILYKSRYDEFYEIPEDFEDIISEFVQFLPEKNILTEEEIHNGLNDISKHDLLFEQKEAEEDMEVNE